MTNPKLLLHNQILNNGLITPKGNLSIQPMQCLNWVLPPKKGLKLNEYVG